MAQVIIENLVKTYVDKTGAAVTAVNGINLTIEDREFMVLVGPSGCGKSTTLRMIAGLEDITAGTITIGGRRVNDVLPKDRDIAMVFQNYALYPHMSVQENMAFGLKLQKVPKAEIDRRVHTAAQMLGLETLLARRPAALSGGQRQRVAVGRAIVRQPKVFLFDEPLSNLDAKMRGSTRTEISKLHARLGATMIYVTHDQIEAMTMGDRICVMKDGHIMQVDEPLNLYNRPANLYTAGFIGSPPMNFFSGRLIGTGQQLRFVETGAIAEPLTLDLPSTLEHAARSHVGQAVVLGIRPEDLSILPAPRPGTSATVKVEMTEPMGAETYLYLNTGPTPFIARVPPGPAHRPDEPVIIGFNPAKLHLFDTASGQALR
jgi:multiple sugar transport system ATP-binding protein